jgi:fructose-1,6-bisphosphatase II / sedoheptulose-1,7-bisphosphatase
MRNEINKLKFNGEVVIGEGELDEAPMLYIGEKLGSGGNLNIDIAVDPLEGTNFVAKNLPGALSVISIAEKGNLFNAPETYMNKLAVSNKVPYDATDLDFSVEKNIKNLADSLNKDLTDITVCLLDRPRHYEIIENLKKMNVKMKLITDGDVSGALMVTDDKYNVDIFLGIGGGPEGVLAAAAIDAYGCKFQGRFIFENDKDILRAKKMGIKDLEKKYDLHEIIKGDSIFCATGITDGDLVKGINIKDNNYITETLVTHKSTNMCKIVIREDTIKT